MLRQGQAGVPPPPPTQAGGVALPAIEPPIELADLRQTLQRYLAPASIADIERAYAIGAQAHEGQFRRSGEPYIKHPLAVANLLASMRLDAATIMAALLHDVLEDTAVSKPDLAGLFGAEVAELVDGVSKLTRINARSKAEAQADSFRKMMLAMTEDIRVILIKLADRLHNMRTLGAMPPAKQRRIARETLSIYAPIANRLGINALRQELEDLGFAALYPMRYRVLAKALQRGLPERRRLLRDVEQQLQATLIAEGVQGTVSSREKHVWSLYQKMRRRRVRLQDVQDVAAVRIIVERFDDCYRVLGLAHGMYRPVPGRFKDYVAIPKTNGYQALHSVLLGPRAMPVEVQIRTREMDYVAEAGVAAHWKYKLGDSSAASPQLRAREWLHSIVELQQRSGNSLEFLEHVKVDLFPDEIYVFTPKGRIMRLPAGATPVDFAYAVHTDIGKHCRAASIDRRPMPLSTQLRNGQTIEIHTEAQAQPNPAWLNFVVTARARTHIRHHLKQLRADDAADLGRRLLRQALAVAGQQLDALPEAVQAQVLEELELPSLSALLQSIGLGEHMAPLVARRILHKLGVEQPDAPGSGPAAPLAIQGTEGMVVTFGRCCHPIPGDPILGYLSSGRGIVVHRTHCSNVGEFRKHPEKWVEVQWSAAIDREFPVALRLEAANQRGVLAVVAATISQLGSNIEQVAVDERPGASATLTFVIMVRNRHQLARVIRRVRATPAVVRLTRSR